MRSSTFITVLCAGLSIASPIVRKALYTEVVTEIEYVFITEDENGSTISPSISSTTSTTVTTTSTSIVVTSTSSTVSSTTSTTSTTSSTPPPPPPTTTSTPPPPPSTTEAPPPPPSTTEAPPAPAAPTTTEAPAAPTYAPVQPTDPTAGLPSGSDFVSTVLMHHNAHRRNHSASDLTYDNTMDSYAQKVAKSCHYAHDLSPGGGGYGQNIAAYGTSDNAGGISSSKIVAQAISDLWYNGELDKFQPSFYGEDNPSSDFEGWGHFSQIVWSSTGGVGCASQLCPSDPNFFGGLPWWFTVCNYSPPGNMGGAYGKNIKQPLGHPTLTS